MNIEVKNSVKPVDYIKSTKILEQRVKDVSLGKKENLCIKAANSIKRSYSENYIMLD